jgi:hypothetical protein
MITVTDLDLPVFDDTAPDFPADRYHRQFAEARAGLAGPVPLAHLVLERGSGGNLRHRQAPDALGPSALK